MMVRCVGILLFLITSYPFWASSSEARPKPDNVRLVNLMPSFWKFWGDAKGKTPAQQLQSWQSLYIQPNESVFRDLDAPCARDFSNTSLEKDYFPVLAGLIPEMRRLEQSLPRTIDETRLRFQQEFPDMAWSGDIDLMASANCFNGRSQMIDGREALLLGLDDIVGLHETNLPTLLEHELFHRYQHSFFAFEPERDEPMWVRLWAEGMATYVSKTLSPSASNWELLWMPDKKVAHLNANLSQSAASFLRSFNSTSKQDANDYFLLECFDQSPNTGAHWLLSRNASGETSEPALLTQNDGALEPHRSTATHSGSTRAHGKNCDIRRPEITRLDTDTPKGVICTNTGSWLNCRQPLP